MDTRAFADQELTDPKLIALKQQMGDFAWGDRVQRAHERVDMLREVATLRAEGLSLKNAVKRLGVALDSHRRWSRRYETEGFVGLLDRSGRIGATHDACPVPRVRTEPIGSGKRGRRALGFVKWVGGKAAVMPHLLQYVPQTFGTYYEPMVGAGTLFHTLQPTGRVVLGDVNADLITCYTVIRDNVQGLIESLQQHVNTQEHFMRVRSMNPLLLPDVERAARFIFLNKTCFNGLYRVNSHGRFNVPYGHFTDPNICDIDTLLRWSQRLLHVDLRQTDYRQTLADATAGDFVYLDPPYLTSGGLAKNNVRYQAEGFDREAHHQLAETFCDLDRRGCCVILSNANIAEVHSLYAGFTLQAVTLRRAVHFDASRRAGFSEVIITNVRP